MCTHSLYEIALLSVFLFSFAKKHLFQSNENVVSSPYPIDAIKWNGSAWNGPMWVSIILARMWRASAVIRWLKNGTCEMINTFPFQTKTHTEFYATEHLLKTATRNSKQGTSILWNERTSSTLLFDESQWENILLSRKSPSFLKKGSLSNKYLQPLTA